MKKGIGVLILAAAVVPMAGLRAQDKTAPSAAKVVITAELVCAHCDFGIGDDCAAALRLDAKTPVLLAGKAAKQFEDCRFDQKVLVSEGTLTFNKKKQLVLTADKAQFWSAGLKNVPAKGTARVEGTPVCGSCDLMICDECTLAVANGTTPIILDGKLAVQHKADGAKSVTVVGQFYVDKKGLIRLYATQVDLQKTK
jgi:hypothetical protein